VPPKRMTLKPTSVSIRNTRLFRSSFSAFFASRPLNRLFAHAPTKPPAIAPTRGSKTIHSEPVMGQGYSRTGIQRPGKTIRQPGQASGGSLTGF
jgi:hypothetical protein